MLSSGQLFRACWPSSAEHTTTSLSVAHITLAVIADHFSVHTSLSQGFEKADMVIEAVFEDIDLKHKVM